MDITNVIFDMDGVLVDTEPLYVAINKGIFDRLGVTISTEQHLSYVGISAVQMWSEIKSQFGLQQTVEELISNEKRAHLDEFRAMESMPPIAGIWELLHRFQTEGIPCAVASSSPREMVELILAESDLRSYFHSTVSGEEVQRGKPAPDIFLLAAERLSADPQSCLVIEDSPHGVRGAIAAGMTTCGFLNPNSGKQDLGEADLTVNHFRENERDRIFQMIQFA